MGKAVKISLAILLIAACSNAQSIERSNNMEAGISAASSFTYTGINSYLLLDARLGRHDLYAGPKIVLSDSYLPYKAIMGYDVGYNFFALTNARLSALVNLDYQISYYDPYNPNKVDIANRKNAINELFLSLGINYRLSRKSRFSVGLNLGTGVFLEKYYDVMELNKNITPG
ncbi:MAG: hypothetical protein JSS96_14285 [Bacteroidetes bacterium]|nr:hypothetical protein [Bacteroidota bacterium]